MLNGMNNKNESNGPGRDATNALASSAPNVTHVPYKSMINITDHLHAKESPVARYNRWPNVTRRMTQTWPSSFTLD